VTSRGKGLTRVHALPLQVGKKEEEGYDRKKGKEKGSTTTKKKNNPRKYAPYLSLTSVRERKEGG